MVIAIKQNIRWIPKAVCLYSSARWGCLKVLTVIGFAWWTICKTEKKISLQVRNFICSSCYPQHVYCGALFVFLNKLFSYRSTIIQDPRSKPQDCGGSKTEWAAEPDECVWFLGCCFFFLSSWLNALNRAERPAECTHNPIPIKAVIMSLHLAVLRDIMTFTLYQSNTWTRTAWWQPINAAAFYIISVHVSHVMKKYSAPHTYLCMHTPACIHANAPKCVVLKIGFPFGVS